MIIILLHAARSMHMHTVCIRHKDEKFRGYTHFSYQHAMVDHRSLFVNPELLDFLNTVSFCMYLDLRCTKCTLGRV